MIHFDVVDFSEHRSEEVIYKILLTLSVWTINFEFKIIELCFKF